jgi:hypothetical protein
MAGIRGRRRLLMLAPTVLAIGLYVGGPHLGAAGTAKAQAPYPGLCDVNTDSNETIQDALLIAQHTVGLTTLPPAIVGGPADCNGSGAVTISDALLVAQKVVGLV